jgi:bacteriocin-like protein
MTGLNNEVREVNVDEMTDNELDSVSGGGIIKNLIALANLEQYIKDLKEGRIQIYTGPLR